MEISPLISLLEIAISKTITSSLPMWEVINVLDDVWPSFVSNCWINLSFGH